MSHPRKSTEELAGELVALRRRNAELQVLDASRERMEKELVAANEQIAELRRENDKLRKELEGRKQLEKALRESEAKFRMLVEKVPHTATYIAALDEKSTTLYVSPQIEKLLGCAAEDYRNDSRIWDRSIHPDDYDRVMSELDRCHHAGEQFALEYRMIRRDGQVIWVDDIAEVVRNAEGIPLYLVGANTDITERKRMESSLREAEQACRVSEEKYREIFNNANDAIYLFGVTPGGLPGNFVEVNDIACQRLGYSREEYLSLSPQDINSKENGTNIADVMAGLRDRRHLMFETTHVAKDGRHIPVEVSAHLFTLHGETRILSVVRDITQRNAYQEKLQELALEVVMTEERERRRIAENLHDSAIQTLAMSVFSVKNLYTIDDLDRLHRELDGICELLDQTLRTTRLLTYELSPPCLYDHGLESALEWLTANLGRRYGISIKMRQEGPKRALGENLRIILFRSVRELLMNVVKHAGAGRAQVKIVYDADAIGIQVRDDGAGFEEKPLAPSDGFGLFSLRERLKPLGGSLEIQSRRGRGSRVTLRVPLSLEQRTHTGETR